MPDLGRWLVRVTSLLPLRWLEAVLARNRPVIFMLHRFSDPERGVRGHDPAFLERTLGHLRRQHFKVVSVQGLLDAALEGRPMRRWVCFTMDDGYHEQATVAAPIFAAFDCPVMTFLVTGFVDARLWLWWDQIAYVFEHTSRPSMSTLIADRLVEYDLGTAAMREAAGLDFAERCKDVPEPARRDAVARLAIAAEVEIPASPPPRYAPMTWEQARYWEERGMSLGPHTVTHPILSRTGDDQSREEIAGSWSRLRTEVRAPVPVFCYPNGHAPDFGRREIDTVESLGFRGALASTPGYVSGKLLLREPRRRFVTPRFALPDSLPNVAQCVGGIERVKHAVRNLPKAWRNNAEPDFE
jgi:peptidoglycan/xylan/chitin deacetylase (PgdA/CDA1 family)